MRASAAAATCFAALVLGACGGGGAAAGDAEGDVSVKTGWPGEYEKISQESIDYLKSKNWWPLPLGTQPGFSSEPVWSPLGLAERRGLEIKTTYFLSGPEINEAAAAGRVVVGFEGNFPFTSLIAQDLPTQIVSVLNPNLRHGLLVAPDSPVNTLDDLMSQGKPVIGVVTGSSGEFFLQSLLEENGLTSNDVVLRNLTPADMLTMPKGLDAVVQWEPYLTQMVVDRKNARMIEDIYPYNFYMGNLWLRSEIVENAPDVAQAITDMYAEGVLYTRENAEKAKELSQQIPVYQNFSDTQMTVLIDRLSNAYKPTWMYPFEDFWSTENARVAKFLQESGRIDVDITAEDWKERFNPEFMDQTFEKLGWKVPERPPWIPEDWEGEVGDPPYPAYVTPEDPPQEWPEPGDLVGN